MDIRKATIEDAELLALLGSETFWDAYRSESELESTYIRAYMSRAFSLSQITGELNDEDISYLIATRNNKNAGYAKLSFSNTHQSVTQHRTMEISRIYLTKSFWGKGLGKQLLAECVDRAKNANRESVWLSVWQSNERAIGFYKNNGFTIVGEVEFDLASSLQKDYVMECIIKDF